MTWVKVTRMASGATWFVNMDRVDAVVRADIVTEIVFEIASEAKGSLDEKIHWQATRSLKVNETPDEIMAQLKADKTEKKQKPIDSSLEELNAAQDQVNGS